LDKFLVSSREELEKNETYKFIAVENAKLLEEAKELKQEIRFLSTFSYSL